MPMVVAPMMGFPNCASGNVRTSNDRLIFSQTGITFRLRLLLKRFSPPEAKHEITPSPRGRPLLSAPATCRNGIGMTTIRDVLNREKWASKAGLKELEVVIIHRGVPGNLKVIKGESITDVAPRAMMVLEGDEESVIPYHRVRIIRRGNIIIWQRVLKRRKVERGVREKC